MSLPLAKKSKKDKTSLDLLKNQQHLLDPVFFHMYLQQVLQEEAQQYSNLLRPDVEWTMSPEFVHAMHTELSRLLKRLVEKSSFFGKYRILSMTDDPSQKNKKDKPRVNVKESDFHFGWKAMKTDVMGE